MSERDWYTVEGRVLMFRQRFLEGTQEQQDAFLSRLTNLIQRYCRETQMVNDMRNAMRELAARGPEPAQAFVHPSTMEEIRCAESQGVSRERWVGPPQRRDGAYEPIAMHYDQHMTSLDSHTMTFSNPEADKEIEEWDRILHPEKYQDNNDDNEESGGDQ